MSTDLVSFPFPNDFLWHDRIEKLPQLGDVVEIMGITFQIEGIEPNLHEDGAFILDVRPYHGNKLPLLRFGGDKISNQCHHRT